MASKTLALYFSLFNEIGIIEQLSRTVFQMHLPDGVLVSHFSVLNHLMRVADGRTPLELASAFQVPKTTMTHTLMLLERRGWIQTRPNPDDRRSKCVWIMPAGRAFREQAIAALAPDIDRLSAVFGPERVEALLPGLEALRREMDAMRAPKSLRNATD